MDQVALSKPQVFLAILYQDAGEVSLENRPGLFASIELR
jgi:hypothetical protein